MQPAALDLLEAGGRRVSTLVVGGLGARALVSASDPLGAALARILVDLTARDCPDDGQAVAEIGWEATPAGAWSSSPGSGRDIGHDLPLAAAVSATVTELDRLARVSAAAHLAVLGATAFDVGGRAVAVVGLDAEVISSLLLAALDAGHAYLAGEVCAIDPADGSVRAHHRPVPVAGDGALRPVSELGALAASSHLALIAFAHRHAGACDVAALTPAEALTRLSASGLGPGAFGRPMFLRFERIVRSVPAVTIAFGQPVSAVHELVRWAGATRE